jgi:hypothetical protein
VTGSGLILDVSGVDGDTTLFLFRSVIDGIEGSHLGKTLVGQHSGDSGGKGSLAVVNVTDGTHVNVGFSTFKFLFCHFFL